MYNQKILDQTIELQQQASNPSYSVFVSASAGSGKTKILTDRVLRLLLSGVAPSKILCLTFTKVAAAEMKNRIYDELMRWVWLCEEELEQRLFNLTGEKFNKFRINQTRNLFALIIDDSAGLQINTIHSFCQNLMKKFPVEAKIAPNFQIINSEIQNKLLIEARTKLLKSAIHDKNLSEKIISLTSKLNENSFADIILELIRKRENLTALKEKYFDIEGVIKKIYHSLNCEDDDEKNIFDKFPIDVDGLKLLASTIDESESKYKKDAKTILNYLKNPTLENFDLYKNIFLTQKEEPRKRESAINDSKLLKSFPFLSSIIETEQKRLRGFIEKINSLAIARSTADLLFIADKMLSIYAQLKTQNNYIDYDDLISKSANLLQNSENAAWIKYKLDGTVEHILIDESQDTNHYQWNIIKSITEDFFVGVGAINKNRTIFVVGDEKQSIYSFQGADPKIFNDIFFYYDQKLSEVNSQIKDIALVNSFRSHTAILKAVDAVFSKTKYQSAISNRADIEHKAMKDKFFGKVELWPIINVPKNKIENENPYEWEINFEANEEYKSKELLAKIIAKTIKKWLDEKRVLASEGRPIRCSDIMILLKKRTNNLGNLLIKYLQDEKIAVRGSDKIKLSAHIIAKDLLALAKFLLLPQDDLNLASALKSPFIGLDEHELFELCVIKNQQKISLFNVLEKSSNPKIKNKYLYLLDLMQKNNQYQYQLYQLFSYILEIKDGKKQVISRFGKEAEEIINQFLNLSLNYHQNNISNLENFSKSLEDSDLEVEIDLNSKDLNEIKITTIHGSKGLEAPIIILADTAHNFSKEHNRIIWAGEKYNFLPFWPAGKNNFLISDIKKINRDLENQEYLRSLYVAMTRAKEELYITGFGNTVPENCWYNIIKNAILPKSKNKLFNFNEILNDGETREYLVCEGLVIEDESEKILEIKVTENSKSKIKIELPEFLNQDPPSEIADEVIYPSKINLKKSDQKFDPNKKINHGKIIHKILELMPSHESAGWDEKENLIKKYLQQNIFLNDQEKELIAKQVFNILNQFPLLFSSSSKAEVPVIGRVGGKLISGKIDRLIINDDEIIILDYKSGDRTDGALENYKKQLFLYKEILQKIYLDKKITMMIMWVASGQLEII